MSPSEASGLRAGARTSHYEVLELLGRGGMGEVWRARDLRLGRDVALKTLRPGETPGTALKSLEREARAASALSHPNIVTVHEVDLEASPPFLAMELVEGQTLSALAAEGRLAAARALDLAAQVAAGLAAAHEAGLVHRDLKPANVVVSRAGVAKVLDFGLARPTPAATAGPAEATLPRDDASVAGALVGTAAYMSPEQAAGRPADFRSDQFALGLLLHELLSGRRTFARASLGDTLAAILHDEAEPVPALPEAVDAATRRVLGRCLAKEPEERYGATRDLARDLADLAALAAGRLVGAGRPPARGGVALLRRGRTLAAAAGIALAAALLGAWAGAKLRQETPPSFRQVTFRRGTVWTARFTAGGEGFFLGASFDGEPPRVFSVHSGGGPPTPFGTHDANLLAVSRIEAAIALDARPRLPAVTAGTLARVPLSAGAPRALVENVLFADWDGAGSLYVVRRADGLELLEAPGGKVLFTTSGWVSHPRVSPDGRHVAFLHHPSIPDDAGDVLLVPSTGGAPRVLSAGWISAVGLAWSARGDEVWFTATGSEGARALQAVPLRGPSRTVYRMPGNITLHDVARDGRVLLAHDTMRVGFVLGREGEEERDAAWLDSSLLTDLSTDGRTLLFTEFGEGGGALYGGYVRPADGGPAERLGDGLATALSPDGRRVLAITTAEPRGLVVLPTGPGAAEKVDTAPVSVPAWASFFPDGKRILLFGSEPEKGLRLYRLDGTRGGARPISPEGVDARFPGGAVSPDGALVAAAADDGSVLLCPVDGSPVRRLHGAPAGLVPVRWSGDGRSLLGFVRDVASARLLRVDAATGVATQVRELKPSDPAGIVGVATARTTPDGRTWIYSWARLLSELYVAEGLR